ncbi:hypothetical protein RhiirC2_774568 [Rhizophagus irregularis]|uniref:Uncharacterized protein n=1 Tax=Rhizophagus irregularis TaxID=588596 RepID=A0A2N1NL74_9GLOM|nr:hypothetical protein RhiirC2_774568 [Rhizophagus irregularis]
MIVAPHVRLLQSAEYQENYIVQGNLLWCRFCNVEVDHKRKDSVDKHIKTVKHLNNKNKNNSNSLLQRTSFENTLNEREKINKEVVEAFTHADIPLEKIEKLKPFLLRHCNNGSLITGANQLREKYLPLSYKTTDRYERHAVNLLFSFDNQTKLARTEFLSNVNASSISQFVMNTIHFYNISY